MTLDCGGNPDAWQETILQVEDIPAKEGQTFLPVGKFRAILAQVDRKIRLSGDARVTIEVSRPDEAMQVYDVAGIGFTDTEAVVQLGERPAICKPRHRAEQAAVGGGMLLAVGGKVRLLLSLSTRPPGNNDERAERGCPQPGDMGAGADAGHRLRHALLQLQRTGAGDRPRSSAGRWNGSTRHCRCRCWWAALSPRSPAAGADRFGAGRLMAWGSVGAALALALMALAPNGPSLRRRA